MAKRRGGPRSCEERTSARIARKRRMVAHRRAGGNSWPWPKTTGNSGNSRDFRGEGRIGSQIHRAVNQRRREFVEFPPAGAAEAGEFSPSQASACGSDCPGEHAFVIPLRLIPDDLDPLRIGLVSSWLCRTPARWARSQQPYRKLPLAPRPASCPSRCVRPGTSIRGRIVGASPQASSCLFSYSLIGLLAWSGREPRPPPFGLEPGPDPQTPSPLCTGGPPCPATACAPPSRRTARWSPRAWRRGGAAAAPPLNHRRTKRTR